MKEPLEFPKLILSLTFFGFILGTMIHEYGHLYMARVLGYEAHIKNFALDWVYYYGVSPVGYDRMMINFYGGFTVFVLYTVLHIFLNGGQEARIGIQWSMIYQFMYAICEGMTGGMNQTYFLFIMVVELIYIRHVFTS